REGVRELPARAERLAVRAGVLRAVVGAQLDALGHVLRAAERVDELRFDGGEDCGTVLVLGDLDDGSAIAAVDRRHQGDDAVAPRPHGGQVRCETAVGLGHGHVTACGFAGPTGPTIFSVVHPAGGHPLTLHRYVARDSTTRTLT